MTKVFTIWLMLVYAFSATGATVHLHYCCGKLLKFAVQDQVSLDGDDCPLCPKHHQNKKNTACSSDESCEIGLRKSNHCQDVKVDAKKTTGEHLPGSDKNLAKIYPLGLPVFTLIGFLDLPLADRHTAPETDDPPRIGVKPLFIQHCTYRI
jgi:hypothetical protein